MKIKVVSVTKIKMSPYHFRIPLSHTTPILIKKRPNTGMIPVNKAHWRRGRQPRRAEGGAYTRSPPAGVEAGTDGSIYLQEPRGASCGAAKDGEMATEAQSVPGLREGVSHMWACAVADCVPCLPVDC